MWVGGTMQAVCPVPALNSFCQPWPAIWLHYCRKERHLNGTVLDSAFCRPALLVTDAWNAQQMAPERPNKEKWVLARLCCHA